VRQLPMRQLSLFHDRNVESVRWTADDRDIRSADRSPREYHDRQVSPRCENCTIGDLPSDVSSDRYHSISGTFTNSLGNHCGLIESRSDDSSTRTGAAPMSSSSDVRVIRLRRREARAALARKSGLALTRSGRSGAAIGGHAPLSVVLPLRGCAPQLSGVRVSRTMAG